MRILSTLEAPRQKFRMTLETIKKSNNEVRLPLGLDLKVGVHSQSEWTCLEGFHVCFVQLPETPLLH